MMPAPSIGRKIQIIGAISSGKSTTASRIALRLGLSYIELDAVRHQTGWVEKTDNEFTADVFSTIDRAGNGWVVAGNYFSILDLSLISRAETVVWLRIPFRWTLFRLFIRTVRRLWTREQLWNGNRESWRVSFFSRNSILLEAIRKAPGRQRRERAILQRLSPQPAVIELTSFRQIDHFVESLPQQQRLSLTLE